jgi:trehalose 6-phosphate synthase
LARLLVVSNRVNLPGERATRAGGLAVAIREALQRSGGVWFGWSGEIAEQSSQSLQAKNAGRINYVTLDLSQADYDEYYIGYANSTLWPVLHYQLGLIDFRRSQFSGYMRVNAYLARMFRPLVEPDDLIWVHDYHLIPLASELRKLGVNNRIGFFLHTPLPAPGVLTSLPYHETIMQALCDYDLVGFQTETDVQAFRDYVTGEAGGQIWPDGTVNVFGKTCRAAAFPIGIDPVAFAKLASTSAVSSEARSLTQSLAGRSLIVGVDRMDYSKGIRNRFDAFGELLSEQPQHRGRCTYLQIAPVSRSEVSQYRALRRELEQTAGRINGKFAEVDWTPIRFIAKSLSRQTLAGIFRISRIALVTPWRDGMNLVAKEYVASQDPEDPGVLILSRFAGAAAELKSALIVNPFDIDQLSAALHRGLEMPRAERRDRWSQMMEVIGRNTITVWRERFLDALRAAPRGVKTPPPPAQVAAE